MKRIIAFCGLVCTECPAFIATQKDDREALEQVAAHKFFTFAPEAKATLEEIRQGL